METKNTTPNFEQIFNEHWPWLLSFCGYVAAGRVDEARVGAVTRKHTTQSIPCLMQASLLKKLNADVPDALLHELCLFRVNADIVMAKTAFETLKTLKRASGFADQLPEVLTSQQEEQIKSYMEYAFSPQNTKLPKLRAKIIQQEIDRLEALVDAANETKYEKKCLKCGKPASKKCGDCTHGYYCSQDCQLADRQAHKEKHALFSLRRSIISTLQWPQLVDFFVYYGLQCVIAAKNQSTLERAKDAVIITQLDLKNPQGAPGRLLVDCGRVLLAISTGARIVAAESNDDVRAAIQSVFVYCKAFPATEQKGIIQRVVSELDSTTERKRAAAIGAGIVQGLIQRGLLVNTAKYAWEMTTQVLLNAVSSQPLDALDRIYQRVQRPFSPIVPGDISSDRRRLAVSVRDIRNFHMYHQHESIEVHAAEMANSRHAVTHFQLLPKRRQAMFVRLTAKLQTRISVVFDELLRNATPFEKLVATLQTVECLCGCTVPNYKELTGFASADRQLDDITANVSRDIDASIRRSWARVDAYADELNKAFWGTGPILPVEFRVLSRVVPLMCCDWTESARNEIQERLRQHAFVLSANTTEHKKLAKHKPINEERIHAGVLVAMDLQQALNRVNVDMRRRLRGLKPKFICITYYNNDRCEMITSVEHYTKILDILLEECVSSGLGSQCQRWVVCVAISEQCHENPASSTRVSMAIDFASPSQDLTDVYRFDWDF